VGTTIRGFAVLGVLLAATATRATAAPADAGVGPLGPKPVVVGVHLSWVRNDAAADCPDAAAIEAQVASRLGDNPFRRTATQFIEAVITRQAETLQATIAMRSTDGKLMGSRTLASTSGDCRSIANAAALTIAILIDPDALMRPAVPPPSLPPRSPLPSPSPTGGIGPSGRVTILAEGSWGLLPRPALGIALAATVEVGRRAAIGITGTFLPERRTSAPNDGFAFGLSTGELDGCFVPVAGGSAAVRAELCGGLSAGLLHAVVYAPAPLDPGQRWAFAATQLMRLVIPLFRAGVLETGAELAEPFPRRSFFVEGQPAGMDTVFTQPALAVTGFVGLGLRWW
jgi:hypothetical protein